MNSPLKLQLNNSKQYFFLLCVIHIGALLCVKLGNANNGWLQSCFAAMIFAHFIVVWCCLFKKDYPKRIVALIHQHDKAWQLQDFQQGLISVELQDFILISQWIVILYFKQTNQSHRTIVLFSDSSTAKNLYQLRFLLNS